MGVSDRINKSDRVFQNITSDLLVFVPENKEAVSKALSDT